MVAAMAAMFVGALAVPDAFGRHGVVHLVAGVWIALHVYELVWWREERAPTRARRMPASAA